MNLAPILARLFPVSEPEGTVVTLTLDLSRSGFLPPEARLFFKDEALGNLGSGARSASAQETLRKLSRRIREFIEHEVRPETDGLFLVAGRTVWEAVELAVPLPNFVTTGRVPYLAPLLAAEAAAPRAWLVVTGRRSARLSEIHLGAVREVLEVEAGPDPDESPGESDVRDRHQRRDREHAKGLLRETAHAVARCQAATPAHAIFFGGRPALVPAFREALPVGLQPLLEAVGPRGDAEAALRAKVGRERKAEMEEFHDLRRQGLRTALGPRDVLEHLRQGAVGRLFVDPLDPVPGVVCSDCATRVPGLRAHCPVCEGPVTPASMVQEVFSYGLAHPPLAVTYVAPGERWLRELDGMAAILSSRFVGRRTVAAGGVT